MSSLKERLKRLKPGETPGTGTGQNGWAEEKPVDRFSRVWEKMGMRICHGETGSFMQRIIHYPLHYRHGKYALHLLAGQAWQLSALTDLKVADHRQLLFIDTETTGLGVGVGNLPFLIGLGYFTEKAFVVEQLFLRNHAEELPVLGYLGRLLGNCSHLVSYNGRTFDWPVIKNRMVMNRIRPDKEPSHIDFLYPSRSLWKHTLPSCRLGKVEEEKLGFVRQEDVPGSLVPALYFQYLTEQDPSLIEGVLLHNERDVLSLAGLAVLFSSLLNGEIPAEKLSVEETYRLAVWFERSGKKDLAARCMKRLQQAACGEMPEYLPLVAAWLKKYKLYDEAAGLWHQYIEKTKQGFSTEPYIQLAMYYEHHRKDYSKALYFAEEALQRVRRRTALLRRQGASLESQQIQKRIDRLRRKMAAGSEVSGPNLFAVTFE